MKKTKVLGTKFSDESAQAAAANTAPSTMLELFRGAPESSEDDNKLFQSLERRNLPPMIKPKDVPIGVAIYGVIVKIVPSPSSEIKGRLIWLNCKGTDFLFPCTGSVRNALAPGLKDDNAKLDETLEKNVGLLFWASRLPNKPSKFDKEMFIFDVRTGPAPQKAKKIN